MCGSKWLWEKRMVEVVRLYGIPQHEKNPEFHPEYLSLSILYPDFHPQDLYFFYSLSSQRISSYVHVTKPVNISGKISMSWEEIHSVFSLLLSTDLAISTKTILHHNFLYNSSFLSKQTANIWPSLAKCDPSWFFCFAAKPSWTKSHELSPKKRFSLLDMNIEISPGELGGFLSVKVIFDK